MTEGYALELVRRLEGGFGDRKLSAGVRAEYVSYLELIGEDRARDAVTVALRTLKYLPRVGELSELAGARAAHPTAPPKPLAPDDPRIEQAPPLVLDLADVPDEFLPTEGRDRPASPEYARYWRGRIRETLAGRAGPLVGAIVDVDLPELEPDELDRDDLEPF